MEDDPHVLAVAVIKALEAYADHVRARGGTEVAKWLDELSVQVRKAEPAISVYLAMQVSDTLRGYADVLKLDGYYQHGADWNIMADKVDRRALNRWPRTG